MRLSATDAAFEGFRATRRHPAVVLAWAVVMLVATIASGLALASAGDAWSETAKLTAADPPDPELIARLAPKVIPAGLAYMAIEIAAAAVVHASVLRVLVRPEERPSLRIGRDELRIVGLLLAFLGVSVAATYAVSVSAALIGMASPMVAQAFASVVGVLVFLVLVIRFSLAGPMTIAERRFRFWSSWQATRRWFWPLFGAEALAASLAAVVVALAYVVFLPIGLLVAYTQPGGGAALAALGQNLINPASLLSPLGIVYLAFVSVLYALVLVILMGPPAELYRLLQAEGERR
jgi:hypothetical protein